LESVCETVNGVYNKLPYGEKLGMFAHIWGCLMLNFMVQMTYSYGVARPSRVEVTVQKWALPTMPREFLALPIVQIIALAGPDALNTLELDRWEGDFDEKYARLFKKHFMALLHGRVGEDVATEFLRKIGRVIRRCRQLMADRLDGVRL
jgi:hypothetical protein